MFPNARAGQTVPFRIVLIVSSLLFQFINTACTHTEPVKGRRHSLKLKPSSSPVIPNSARKLRGRAFTIWTDLLLYQTMSQKRHIPSVWHSPSSELLCRTWRLCTSRGQSCHHLALWFRSIGSDPQRGFLTGLCRTHRNRLHQCTVVCVCCL